jgi:phosphatidylserine/phosphatidylglycerophosphate/cardiolipin synthase-like enzyme
VKRILVVANETLPGKALNEALRRRAAEGPVSVTVLAPVNQPREGYVVYVDTRRAAAGRRLDRTLAILRKDGIPAYGFVVECGPVDAVRDELAQSEYDEVLVSTHPEQRSGWVRRNVVEQIRRAAESIPVEHVVVDLKAEPGDERNVVVVANETVLGKPLLDRIRARAGEGRASFLIIAPQSHSDSSYEDAERRLRHALAELRGAGIEVHGQIAHPDPYTAAMQSVRDERVDELIVSTYPRQRSGWLRRDLVERLRKDSGLPVDHVVVEPERMEVAA